jgi:RNA polymerase-binding transcription factor DksA
MPKKRTRVRGLTPDQVNKFKALLLEKRREILGNVNFMEGETLRKDRTDLSSMPFHMADMGTDNYELENTVGLVDSERKMLIEIEDALSRMEDGAYGVCQGHSGPILRARLEAIPWARYCVACAGLSEKGLVVEEESSGESDDADSSDDSGAEDDMGG